MSNFRGRGGQQRGSFEKGTWKCDCKLPAIHLQTKKAGPNQGKWFYTCAKDMGDKTKCKFFLWHTDAQPREQAALMANSRSEPPRADATPSRPQRAPSPPPPYTIQVSDGESPRKRSRATIMEEEDFGLGDDDEEFNEALIEAETPRKAARTDEFTTPRRKLPWDNAAQGLPTPQTERRNPNDLFATRFTEPGSSSLTPSKKPTPQTVTPSSSFETPSSTRFKDVSSGTPLQSETLVDDVFNLLGEHNVAMTNNARIALRALLTKHSNRSLGNIKAKDVLRAQIAAKEKANTELIYRNDTLQAELAAAKAEKDHLLWEAENRSD